MKRFLALVLVAILSMSTCALADYDKHVSFTVNGTHTNSNMDYNHDGLYDFIAGKYNFDYEVFPVSKDAQAEKIRVWVNGGTMPDLITWRDFQYQEYVNYAEQGLLAPLPDGWQEKYPDLYRQMVGCMGEEQFKKFEVDGKFYGIAHARNYRFNPVDKLVDHISVYYRKDWAKQLGMEIGEIITISQLKDYLKGCVEQDMAGNGNTIGMSEEPSRLATFFTMFSDVDYMKFYKTDDGYAWGFANETVLNAAKMANEWYKEGLIDQDFYLNQSAEAISNFTSGVAAFMFGNCQASSYLGYKQQFNDATGLNSDECVGIATIATDDGVTRAIECLNWWSVSIFSPDTDPEVLDRILAAMDYCSTKEGQVATNMGIPGQDWEIDENNNVKNLMTANEDGSYPNIVDVYNSYNVFRTWGLNADDFLFINPTYNKEVIIDPILSFYQLRTKGYVIPMDVDYEFFSSDNKANYSLNLKDEFAKLVIGEADALETEWKNYIEANKNIWQPVIDDLNAEFFGR